MAHLPFHNDTVSLNHIWYHSHKNMIATVCIKLGQHDKIAELTTTLLGEPLKIKPMKDPEKPKRPTSGYLYFCQDARPAIMKNMSKKEMDIIGNNARKYYNDNFERSFLLEKIEKILLSML